jgi:chitinase
MFSTIFSGLAALVAVVSAIPQVTTPPTTSCITTGKLNLYWGQSGLGENTRLIHYCRTFKPEYVSVSFMHYSPENAGGAYPGTNFAGHCGAEVYYYNRRKTLLGNCPQVAEDVNACKKLGVKILLSLGGAYGNVSLATVAAGEAWASFLYKAYGPYRAGVNVPRPFDFGNQTFVIDGFDFDLEQRFKPEPFIAMGNKLRALFGRRLILTAAPQCPLQPEFFLMSGILEKLSFNALFIQFYNNPLSCTGRRFNYKDWEAYVSRTAAQASTKLYVGLTADPSTSGYLPPADLKTTMCGVMKGASPHFGGISIWDAYVAERNTAGNSTYIDAARKILACPC